MPSNTTPVFLGLDVHKNTISAGILRPGEEVPDVEKISSDEEPVRRLIGRLGNPRRLRACYEAGPTGHELARLLGSLGVACQVIAPALVPTAPGDRVKADNLRAFLVRGKSLRIAELRSQPAHISLAASPPAPPRRMAEPSPGRLLYLGAKA